MSLIVYYFVSTSTRTATSRVPNQLTPWSESCHPFIYMVLMCCQASPTHHREYVQEQYHSYWNTTSPTYHRRDIQEQCHSSRTACRCWKLRWLQSLLDWTQRCQAGDSVYLWRSNGHACLRRPYHKPDQRLQNNESQWPRCRNRNSMLRYIDLPWLLIGSWIS